MFELFYLINSLVANTLEGVQNNRRCWRMIGGILVEKDLDTVKQDLVLQITNVIIIY